MTPKHFLGGVSIVLAIGSRVMWFMIAKPQVLRGGVFYGTHTVRVAVRGFDVMLMTPTVPGEEVPEHTHAEGALICILSGVYLSDSFGGLGRSVGPRLIYSPPGTTHRDRFETLNGGRFLAVSVADETLERVSSEAEVPKQPSALGSCKAMAIALSLAAFAERGHELSVEEHCLELLACVSRTPGWRETRLPRWLLSARDRLWEECTAGDLFLATVADSAGVHPVHFSRAFRQFFRMTPGAFVRRARVLHAARLLLETETPLAAIALESGFSDQSHLTNAFRRELKIPPGLYRHWNGGGSNGVHNSYKTRTYV